MRAWPDWGNGSSEGRGAKCEGRATPGPSPLAPLTPHFMKILVANLGSTSLKWRLFDFANGQERLLHKGGFERVIDYPKAIEDCLAQLKDAGHIASERDLAAIGFKTVMAKGVTGCVQLDEKTI